MQQSAPANVAEVKPENAYFESGSNEQPVSVSQCDFHYGSLDGLATIMANPQH
ncbi:hypothetical protein CPT_Moabite_320 [Serratia phage Moabite]|uniref:Uncharacterized protein n=3 Tax=Moabitevirus TaxID=2843422 RepID=A0A7T3NBU8_9CAUD|nr:hypothetical protein HWB23_gp250 [Serratia phage vB_SmaM_ 2050HW]YP_009849414.1 hypothetical protein HWC48_gp096 [Serratia phage Moabite]QPX76834.1 hypothetical protein [Serratia phage vB_SmaM_Yaphecito]UCR74841.1 hypothetical protein [Serratia phage BUCT660]UGO54202.1 hypothetical protein HAYMO_220 [Serratia phage vB_SmaM_Haymo]UQT03708.1 hypothetical protein KODAMA_02410 [Serratia phage vB_SmaM-Kodama]URG14100.1 hypothetical protein [Pectobacterium phage vB_ParM-25]